MYCQSGLNRFHLIEHIETALRVGMGRTKRAASRPRKSPNKNAADQDDDIDQPAALTYFLIGIILLLVTGSLLLFWLLRPLPQIKDTGFAWLAIPKNGSGFSTKEVDLTYKVELIPGANPSIEYDILAPCGNKVTTVALYLGGLSRLKNIQLITGGREREVSGSIPELGQQSGMQLITGTIVDGPICSSPVSKDTATALAIQGTSIAPLAFHNYSQREIALPVVGYPWVTNMVVTAPPGLQGSWTSPLRSKISVSVSPLQLQDRIDISHPATESGSSLDWSSSYPLRVSAIWTDTAADRRVQIYIFILGVFGGIGGTFVVEGIEPAITKLLKKLSKAKKNLMARLSKAKKNLMAKLKPNR